MTPAFDALCSVPIVLSNVTQFARGCIRVASVPGQPGGTILWGPSLAPFYYELLSKLRTAVSNRDPMENHVFQGLAHSDVRADGAIYLQVFSWSALIGPGGW